MLRTWRWTRVETVVQVRETGKMGCASSAALRTGIEQRCRMLAAATGRSVWPGVSRSSAVERTEPRKSRSGENQKHDSLEQGGAKMRKATTTGPASKKSGARQSLDMHAAASQPSRSETTVAAHYTSAALLTRPRRASIPVSQAQWPPLPLERDDLCRNSYCRPYTAMHPLALCVPQSPPDCVGTKI